ncbi:hypothetical protein LR48_Vigan317s001400 [Vigna angularis]|uniref:Uncharacterized protein n=1 Tax=Phaseolus angularis TaxID=3914 RepID=A0A0L9T884_PHAAN|nr:hypothetical protein LR48_Vigan317s001400 [Vigna angularis]
MELLCRRENGRGVSLSRGAGLLIFELVRARPLLPLLAPRKERIHVFSGVVEKFAGLMVDGGAKKMMVWRLDEEDGGLKIDDELAVKVDAICVVAEVTSGWQCGGVEDSRWWRPDGGEGGDVAAFGWLNMCVEDLDTWHDLVKSD